jgi:hypothetical protein
MSAGPPTLRDRITYWQAQGYRVISETPTSAQLVRPRRFNPMEFIAMPLYALEYLGQRDRDVYLSVATDGTVKEEGSAVRRSRYRGWQDRQSTARRFAIVFGGFAVIIILVLVLQALPK